MGADKATLEVEGRAMAMRAAGALADAGCEPVVFVGSSSERLALLGPEVIADHWPGEGPLGALATAVAVLPGRDLVVVACDLPFLTGRTVAAVVAAESAGVAVAHGERREPLCAHWSAMAAAVAADAFAAGSRAVHEGLAAVEAAGLAVVEVAVAPASVYNVNTPDDLPR
jgi:molybdopterin-guanine dinucleotide biosynthesis protein A